MIFRSQANKTHFHEKCCALSLTLKVRVFGTRKWPIALARKLGSMLLTCNNISPDWDKQHINQGFCFLFLPSPNNNSLWKQPTFHEAATGFPAKWRLRKERAQKCHTRLRALVHHTSFRGETSGGVAKCRLFSQATAISFTMFQATSSGHNVVFVFYKNTFSRSMRMKKVIETDNQDIILKSSLLHIQHQVALQVWRGFSSTKVTIEVIVIIALHHRFGTVCRCQSKENKTSIERRRSISCYHGSKICRSQQYEAKSNDDSDGNENGKKAIGLY